MLLSAWSEMVKIVLKKGSYESVGKFIAEYNKQMTVYGNVHFDKSTGKILDGAKVEVRRKGDGTLEIISHEETVR